MALKVVQNEIDGWDVVREDEDVALSNHPDLASAEAAAKLRAEEEHIGESGGGPGIVAPDEVHAVDDARQGMKPAFLYLGGLLILITILVIVLSLTGSVTRFGSEPPLRAGLSAEPEEPLVLVADDDEDVRELVVFRLARAGYQVITAGDGEEAVA